MSCCAIQFQTAQTRRRRPIWVRESNGQLLTHSNHLGTHLDGEIRFFTAGKDIAQLDLNDFLVGPGVVVLRDAYARLTKPDIRAALAYAADTLAHETILLQPA